MTSPDPTTSTPRTPLSTARIVAAGIELADVDGVAGLTMRRLADQLGFKVMALYNHVASKDQLLGLMVDAIAGSIELPTPEPDTTTAVAMRAVRAQALETRAVFLRHPWAPDLWLRYHPGPNRIDHMEQLLRTLNDSGLSSRAAHHGFHAITNHVLGYTLQEQAMELDPADMDDLAAEFLATISPDTHPHTVAHVRQHLDGDTGSSFELVLDLIIDGLSDLDDPA